MSTMGTRMGASVLKPPGSVPYWALSSSYVATVSAASASSAALTRLPMKRAYRMPAMSGMMDASTPMLMTSSRSSDRPSEPAAAMGPGVGGMNTCEMYRPADRHTVSMTELAAVRLTMALRMGFRMTKPESQNTGMETIQPMSAMAISGCFLPTSLTTMSASLNAPPVASRMEPTSAPRMMTMPMLVNVPEKPAPMTDAMPETFVPSSSVWSTSGMPATRPNTSETSMMEMNGWILNLEIITIMSTMAITNATMSAMPVMGLSFLRRQLLKLPALRPR